MKLFPWNGFLYELRRALLSVPLIVVTVVIVLASFGLLSTIAASQPPPFPIIESSSVYYFSGGEYHFEFYAYDGSGNPVSGVNVSLQVFPSNGTLANPSTSIANTSGQTGSTGLVQLGVPVNGSNYTVVWGWSPPNGGGSIGNSVLVTRPAPGLVEPFGSGFTNSVYTVHRFLATYNLLIFFPGPNGTAPPDYQVYWAGPQNGTLPAAPLAENAMHHLGALTLADQVFSLLVPRQGNPAQDSGYLQVEIFTTQGTLVATDTNQSASNFFGPPGGFAGTSAAFTYGGTILAFLVPLMAILASYSVYGKDRLTGVLEGVLVRPVSRLGLASSRYLAVVVALTLAATVAMGCLEALIAWVYGGFMPLGVALTMFSALLVEIGAFTGITFVLSHTFRSATGLVGVGLGLFALFTVGWLILPNIIGGLTGTLFTPGYDRTLIHLEFLNPAQFLYLTESLFLNAVQGLSGPRFATAPSAYGVTLGSVIATGLAWILAPAALLVFVVRRHD